MKIMILSLSVLFLYACTTRPVSSTQEVSTAPQKNVKPSVQYSAPTGFIENVDQEALKFFLKLNLEYNKLGYFEKTYNTCEVGYGYSPTQNCRKKTFVVIHFQLMCRNSEGTISQALTQRDLKPLNRQDIKWNLKNSKGAVLTDSEGFAEIAMISPESQRTQRLKLNHGNDFLFLKAGEITQMITPMSWCD